MAASLVGTGVSQQPSWAHVVRGACAVPQHQLLLIPLAPPLPMLHTLVGKMTVSVNAEALLLAKSNLIKHGKQAVDKTASWWFVAYKTAKAVGDQLVVGNGEKEVGEDQCSDFLSRTILQAYSQFKSSPCLRRIPNRRVCLSGQVY